ncbi:energy transducer TonB [uncultured Psychroserpens sp.]|uniref:energy transducer TonB n=1 Tax=uncultured Psychroserpens sp. TaxID=255436 RepID=UPI002601F55F|nr:energy transducer TonB [uncultured Psychroserpens sp.]
MKYFKTKHEKNSARLTTLLVLILVLLIFVVGLKYMDPPLEYGVAINFGNSEVGSGNIQPKVPIRSKPKQTLENNQPEEVQQSSSQPDSKAEDVITNESTESIAIKKQKEADAKAKAEAERIERERIEAEEKKRKEEEAKKKNIDNLFNGVKNADGSQAGGEGNDSQPGDKGQLDGNPYAPSYFGGSGPGKGGVGSGLGGRGSATKKIFKQECNETGLVVVKIIVDRSGKVLQAEPGIRGSTNTHPCLLAPAKKIALSHKWPSDSKAPARQVGFVSINFDVSQ